MSFKSKFQQESENFKKKNISGFDNYLDLKQYNLEKFKFEKEQKDYLFDILPYKIETEKHPDFGKKEKTFFLEIFVHSYMGINKGNYLCMKKMYNQECAICNEFVTLKEKLEKEGLTNKEIWEQIKDLAYKQRILYYILYNGKKYILDIPYRSFQQVWELAIEKKKSRGIDIFPIYLNEEGCTSVEFTYIPKGQNFFDLVNFDFPEITNFNEKNLEGLVSLEKLLIIPDQKVVKDSLLGIYDEDNKEQEAKDYYEDVTKKEIGQQEQIKQEVKVEEPVKKIKSLNECPFNERFGTNFGKDWDGFTHCDECNSKHNEIFLNCKKAFDGVK